MNNGNPHDFTEEELLACGKALAETIFWIGDTIQNGEALRDSKGVVIATEDEAKRIFEEGIEQEERSEFFGRVSYTYVSNECKYLVEEHKKSLDGVIEEVARIAKNVSNQTEPLTVGTIETLKGESLQLYKDHTERTTVLDKKIKGYALPFFYEAVRSSLESMYNYSLDTKETLFQAFDELVDAINKNIETK